MLCNLSEMYVYPYPYGRMHCGTVEVAILQNVITITPHFIEKTKVARVSVSVMTKDNVNCIGS